MESLHEYFEHLPDEIIREVREDELQEWETLRRLYLRQLILSWCDTDCNLPQYQTQYFRFIKPNSDDKTTLARVAVFKTM